jgi:hypothetical protein
LDFRPLRFLGWKDAARRGPDVLKHFLRLARRPNQIGDSGLGLIRSANQGFPTTHPPFVGVQLRQSLPAGLLPSAVVTADLNGDGKLDWIVANAGDDTLYVYFGNGNGSSQPPVIIPLTPGQVPLSIAVADINGDGKLDIAVADTEFGIIGILYGNGDGTFQPEQIVGTLPTSALSIAIADVNGDKKLDLIVGIAGAKGTPAPGRFATLLNTGGGNFGPPIYATNNFGFDFSNGEELSIADVNNDGKLDVLVTGNDTAGGEAQIFLGNGDGTFTEGELVGRPILNLLFRSLTNAVIADVNKDGCPDVVGTDTLAEAVIFLGNCTSAFDHSTTPPVYGMGDFPFGLAVADLDGDGFPDLIIGGIQRPLDTTGYASGNTVGVRLNDGHGHFGPLRLYRGDPGIFALTVGDLAGNGRPEIITANQDANTITVYLNNGLADFGQPAGGYDGEEEGVGLGPINSPDSVVTPTDFDGDGIPDLALIEFPDSTTNLLQAAILLGQGNGKFAPPVKTPMFNGKYQIADFVFADFRKTGQKDFVGLAFDDTGFCNPPQLLYAKNAGAGHLATPVPITFPVVNACFAVGVIGVGDFNHDGKLDFVLATLTGNSASDWQLTVYLGNGDGTFQAPVQSTVGHTGTINGFPHGIFVEDANGDNKMDILVYVTTNDFGSGVSGKDLFEFLGNGDGTFQPPIDVLQNLDFMTMSDLNHDGRLDVIQIETTGQWGETPAIVSVHMGLPNGSFGPATSYAQFTSPFNTFIGNNVTLISTGPYIGDFNGDGNTDVALFQIPFQGISPFVQFLLGNGDGTFTPTFLKYDMGIEKPPDIVVPNALGDGRTAFLQTPNYPASFHLLPTIPAPLFQVRVVETPVLSNHDSLVLTLNVASATDTTVFLTASDPGVLFPGFAVVPSGALSAIVPFTVSGSLLPNHWFTITAQEGATSAAIYDYVPDPSAPNPFSLIVGGGFVPPSFAIIAVPGDTTLWGAGITSGGSAATSTFQVSCSNLPPGISCADFSSQTIDVAANNEGSVTFSIPTSTSTPPGSYVFTVTATDGSITLNSTPTLLVSDFTMSASPQSVSVDPTSLASYDLTFGALFGFNQMIHLTCSGLPAGANCQTQNFYFVGTGEGVGINLSNVAPGTYNVMFTGTIGPLTHSATVQLTVVSRPAITVSQQSFSFSPILIGTTSQQTLKITNSGTSPLNINGFTVTPLNVLGGTFSVPNNCSSAIAPGGSCTLTITFNASNTVSPASANLAINSNVTATVPPVSLNAQTFDFLVGISVGGSPSVTISAGQTATYSLAATATGLVGNILVTLACNGAPSEAQCSPSSSQISVSGSSPASFNAIVTTTAATTVFRPPSGPGVPTVFHAFELSSLLLFFCALLFLLGITRRTRAVLLRRAMPVWIVLCFAALASTGCGGGGGVTGPPVIHDPGTPHGSFTLTVTATSSGSSRTTQLTLTVQ